MDFTSFAYFGNNHFDSKKGLEIGFSLKSGSDLNHWYGKNCNYQFQLFSLSLFLLLTMTQTQKFFETNKQTKNQIEDSIHYSIDSFGA